MAIDAGDVVLTFLGDMTQLEDTIDSIPGKTSAAMGAAATSIGGAAGATSKFNAELDATGENVPFAGEKIEEAFTRGGNAARGMSEKLRVSEEMVGVRLPRGVNKFLATLPGLGVAIDAAFSASVVFFLVEALVKVSEKISAVLASTFIYTQAMKDSDAATAKLNGQLVEIAANTQKANMALGEFGMTAVQKTTVSILANAKAYTDNAFAITANRVEAAKLQDAQMGLGAQMNELSGGLLNTLIGFSAWGMGVDTNTLKVTDNRKAIQALNNEYTRLSLKNQELAKEMALLGLQLRDEEDSVRKQGIERQRSYNVAIMEGTQALGKATLDLTKAQAEEQVAATNQGLAQRILINAQYDNASFQIEQENQRRKHASEVAFQNEMFQLTVANLQNRIAVEKTLGPIGVAAAMAAEQQIVDLTKQHNVALGAEDTKFSKDQEARQKDRDAKAVKEWADVLATIHAQIRKGVEVISQDATWEKPFQKMIKEADDISAAFDQLGVVSLEKLKVAADNAGNAYTFLSKNGRASAHDLALAWKATLQAQEAYQRALGDTTGANATAKSIEQVEKDLTKFEGTTTKAQTLWDRFTADFKKKSKETGAASQDMGKMLSDSAKDIQGAFESAIESAILSEESFGAALKKATAQVLAHLSAQAAMYALYYTAQGIADAFWNPGRAGADFAAAAEFMAVAAATGVAAHGLAGGGKQSGGGSGGGAQIDTSQPGNTAAQNPTSTANVPHLGSGALVTGPTLTMLAEHNKEEAVIPLRDPRATREIAEALGQFGGGGGIHNEFKIGSMISTSDLSRLGRVLTRASQTGRVRVSVSNASRVTRKV